MLTTFNSGFYNILCQCVTHFFIILIPHCSSCPLHILSDPILEDFFLRSCKEHPSNASKVRLVGEVSAFPWCMDPVH